VALWGIVIVAVVLTPGTVLSLANGQVDALELEFFAFVWAYVVVGYFLGIWMARDAWWKGMNGVTWGLLFAGPWWPFILVAYSFASYQRPYLTPPS
jgi:hypothetical protein